MLIPTQKLYLGIHLLTKHRLLATNCCNPVANATLLAPSLQVSYAPNTHIMPMVLMTECEVTNDFVSESRPVQNIQKPTQIESSRRVHYPSST